MSEKNEDVQARINGRERAKIIFKRYGSARKLIHAMEKYRPSLLNVIGAKPGAYKWDDYGSFSDKLALVHLPAEDHELLEEYIESAEIVDIIRAAICERLRSSRNLDEIQMRQYEDFFINGMSTPELMKKHGICERTVRNIKKRGMKAIEDEVNLRVSCGRTLSSIF
ncbi:MAG: hypothetical protein BACD_00163 [Bacteroides rodentium]